MNEQIKPTQLLDIAEMQANQPEQLSADEARIREWIGKPGEDPQAARDVAEYLKSRPYTDESGRLHDPQTDEVVKHNDYHNKKEDEHFESTGGKPTSEQTARELLDTLADAVENNDRTVINDVEDVINSRDVANQPAEAEDKQAKVQEFADAMRAKIESDERRAEKEALVDMETDELIRAWAKAELDGDDEIASLAQDELQDQLVRARMNNVYEEHETSDKIDDIYEMKENEKNRLLNEQSAASEAESKVASNPKVSREIRESLESEEGAAAIEEASAEEPAEPKQELYDYDEMIKDKPELPETEAIDPEEDVKKITLRGRFKRIKDSAILLPSKLVNRPREHGEKMSAREKIALGLGTTALAAGSLYTAHKLGLDLPFVGESGGNGGGNSLAATPDLLAPEQADTSLLDQITDSNSPLAQETNALGATDFSQFEYPIDWAMQNGGADAPLEFLKSLGERAAQDGHNVQWMPAAGGGEYVVIDGMTSAEDTLRILSQYKS